MIGWMIRAALYALASAALAYVIVFVPVGRHTLYRHAARIIATSEAQELRASLADMAASAKQALVRETIARAP